MSTPEQVRDQLLQRLQSGLVDELAELVVDHVLDTPVEELLDAEWLAGQVVHSLRAATDGPKTEEWLSQQIRSLQARVPDGKIGDQLPDEVLEPLRQVLSRPTTFNRELVVQLLDHEAARALVKDLLRGSLDGFTARLRTISAAMPPAPAAASRGIGRLKALSQGVRTVGEGVLGGIGRELEERSAQRISEFLDTSLSAAMGQVADHLTNPRHAEAYGAYRVHVLDTILETDNRVANEEFEKLDPDALVAAAAATTRVVAARPELRAELTQVFRTAMQESGNMTLRGFLSDTGIEETAGSDKDADWRRELHEQISHQVKSFIETDAFSAWLLRLVEPV